MITLDSLKRHLPKNSRRVVTQSTVDTINALTEGDGEVFAEVFKENFISYTKVLTMGEYRINDYMNAVRYVSYLLMQHSNIDAYMKTFPDRYDGLLLQYQDFGDEAWIRDNKIASYASMYNQNKLVNQVREQSIIPSKILNAPMFQQALNVQAHIMLNSRSDMVRMQAANSILIHLKPDETVKIELDIGLKENDAISELRKVTQELAATQRLAIQSGSASTKEIAESVIIEAEVDE